MDSNTVEPILNRHQRCTKYYNIKKTKGKNIVQLKLTSLPTFTSKLKCYPKLLINKNQDCNLYNTHVTLFWSTT